MLAALKDMSYTLLSVKQSKIVSWSMPNLPALCTGSCSTEAPQLFPHNHCTELPRSIVQRFTPRVLVKQNERNKQAINKTTKRWLLRWWQSHSQREIPTTQPICLPTGRFLVTLANKKKKKNSRLLLLRISQIEGGNNNFSSSHKDRERGGGGQKGGGDFWLHLSSKLHPVHLNETQQLVPPLHYKNKEQEQNQKKKRTKKWPSRF